MRLVSYAHSACHCFAPSVCFDGRCVYCCSLLHNAAELGDVEAARALLVSPLQRSRVSKEPNCVWFHKACDL